MNKYNEVEVKTAQNLLKEGYKWIVRYETGRLFAHCKKPFRCKVNNVWGSVGLNTCVCDFVPIFQSIRSDDKEPVSLESIVHPQILDDAEKRYLSAVIRPFRDRVKYIVKYGGRFSYVDYEEIAVRYQDKMSGNKCCFLLPKFEKGTMYKGMELNRHYTLEEIGL